MTVLRSPRTRSGAAISALALVASMTLAACGSASSDGSDDDAAERPVNRNATVQASMASLPQQLDPHESAVLAIDFRMLNLVYDRLLSIGPDGELKPMLATAWDYSDKGRTLTLTLRDDAKFDDGTPVDGDVVAANIKDALKGSAGVAGPIAAITDVKATSPTEVVISLKSPTTQVLSSLAANAGLIMHPDILEGKKAATTTNGSGPYAVEEFKPGAKIVLKRKDNIDQYWDKEAAQVATFEVNSMVESRAITSALKSGQLQMGFFPDPIAVEDLKPELDNGKLKVEKNVASSWLALSMNREMKPFDDVNVRRAVNQAIDRDTLEEIFFPGSEPATQWARESSPFHVDDIDLGYDVDAAKQTLADAGHPDGIDIGTIQVSTSVSPTAAEAIQGMLAEAGITAELQMVDATQVFANYAEGSVAATINWSGGMSAASAEVSSKLAESMGPSRIQPGPTPELAKMITELDDNQLSDEETAAKGQEINTYLTEEAFVAPIVFINYPWVYDPDLTGLSDADYDYATVYGPYDWRYWALHE